MDFVLPCNEYSFLLSCTKDFGALDGPGIALSPGGDKRALGGGSGTASLITSLTWTFSIFSDSLGTSSSVWEIKILMVNKRVNYNYHNGHKTASD